MTQEDGWKRLVECKLGIPPWVGDLAEDTGRPLQLEETLVRLEANQEGLGTAK